MTKIKANTYFESIQVSVVINTYNRARLLPRAINSALQQTHSNFEIVLIDASSSDDTEDVVRAFSDSRIRYFRSDITSPSHCMNIAFDKCNGKYIALLDDDDEWLPTKTEEQIKLFEKLDDSYGWIGCGELFIDDTTGNVTRKTVPYHRGEILTRILYGAGNGVSGGTTLMFRKSVIDKMGGFVDVDFSTDFLFYLKLSRAYKYDYVSKHLVLTHENHIYQNQRASCLPNNIYSINRKIKWNKFILYEYSDVFREHPKLSYKYLSWLARNHIQIGHKMLALKYFYLAIRANPFALKCNLKLAIKLILLRKLRISGYLKTHSTLIVI